MCVRLAVRVEFCVCAFVLCVCARLIHRSSCLARQTRVRASCDLCLHFGELAFFFFWPTLVLIIETKENNKKTTWISGEKLASEYSTSTSKTPLHTLTHARNRHKHTPNTTPIHPGPRTYWHTPHALQNTHTQHTLSVHTHTPTPAHSAARYSRKFTKNANTNRNSNAPHVFS